MDWGSAARAATVGLGSIGLNKNDVMRSGQPSKAEKGKFTGCSLHIQ